MIKLPYLAISPPARIAVSSISQIEMRDFIQAPRGVEARGQFVSERLIVNKAVGEGRADGLFVEALGSELATFQSGDLGADQRGAVLEIVRAIVRPGLELFVMLRQSL